MAGGFYTKKLLRNQGLQDTGESDIWRPLQESAAAMVVTNMCKKCTFNF